MRARHVVRSSAGSSASGPARPSPRPAASRPRAPGRPCPSASGRGSAARRRRRRRAASARPRVQAAASRGRSAVARPERAARRRSAASALAPGAASPRRPVSIGLMTIRSRSKLEDQELAAPRRRSAGPGPSSAASSAGVPRTTSGCGDVGAGRARRPAERGVERVGEDGAGRAAQASRRRRSSRSLRRMVRGRMPRPCRQDQAEPRARPERRSLSSPPGHGRPTDADDSPGVCPGSVVPGAGAIDPRRPPH